MNIEFEEESHTYRVNGVIFPSVTQVLEEVQIIDYRQIPWETREMALKRGSRVHRMTEFYDQDDLDESAVHPSLEGYLIGWQRFRAQHEVGRLPITHIEHRGAHVAGYAGTVDRVFNGKVLADIKCGAAPWWVRIQLASYTEMLYASGTEVQQRICVELPGNGTFRVIPIPRLRQREDFNSFMAALRVHQEKQLKRF
jgi:hypothetical protein